MTPASPIAQQANRTRSRSEIGRRFDRLVEIMRILRSHNGCPWDREQTRDSLRPFLLQETYEVLDAIDRGDHNALREEIGDLMFEAVFLAQLCAEDNLFTILDALDSILDKLIRRHPHVFGDSGSQTNAGSTDPISSGRVARNWEQIKAKERANNNQGRTLLEGVPSTLPSLLRAYEIGNRVASVGFDLNSSEDLANNLKKEVPRLKDLLDKAGHVAQVEDPEDTIGDHLLTIVNLARKAGVEPEAALRRVNNKLTSRFAELEKRFLNKGSSIHDASPEDMKQVWNEIKNGQSPNIP